MLLNLGLNKKAPNIVTAPKSNIDVNAILGLTPSKYSGLQSVRDTGYYYGNNRMYEAYTPPPSTGGYYGIFGYNRPSNPYPMFGYQAPSKPSYEEVTIGGQQFRTVNPDIAGFNKTALSEDDYQKDSVYKYAPSMAYVYSKAPKTAPLPTPNVTSFLSTPTTPSYAGNYGAGRFMGGMDGLLGSMPLSFGLPSGESANG